MATTDVFATIDAISRHRDWMEARLKAVAGQLDRWAVESERGGWSTHQVDAMRREADAIRRGLLEWRP